MTQALKQAPAVLDHTLAPGFLAGAEYRLDWSNQRFFLSTPLAHSNRPNRPLRSASFSGVAQIYPLIRIENAGVRRKDRFFTDFLQVDEFES